jgi:hypothetical protein
MELGFKKCIIKYIFLYLLFFYMCFLLNYLNEREKEPFIVVMDQFFIKECGKMIIFRDMEFCLINNFYKE